MIVPDAAHRILVIEHNAWIRADLVAQLRTGGYHVRDASNGFTGLRLARGVVPDLIVLGGALPEIGAAQVREELASDPATRSVPVVALGADGRNVSCPVAAKVRQLLEARGA